MKATMKDVAALAGVGLGSVSNVINGVKVKTSTREKVEAAIRELNYEPNTYARGLKVNRTNTIALILPTIWHPFFAEFTYYVEEALSKKNYKILLCNSDGIGEKEKEYIQMVRQSKVDGILGITYSDIDKYVSSNLPFVSIDRHFSEEVAYVTSDNYTGGQIAAQELIKRGCKQLMYVTTSSPYPYDTLNRKSGFYDVCVQENIIPSMLDIPEPFENIAQLMLDHFKVHQEVEGIFATTDILALRVIKTMKKLGKKLLRDYQIIGFDGMRLIEEEDYLVSTLVQSTQLMAESAVETLLAIIEKKPYE